MAMAFACVSSHELRGGPVVSSCLIYHICLSHSPNHINSFTSPITYFSHSNSWLWWVTTAIDIILTPQALSDVTTTDADHEGGEWYPKTKLIADILKKNGDTKLVSEGRKWYHKTLNANILVENDKTKLVGEGHKQYHKVDEDPDPEPVFFDPSDNPETTPVPFNPNHNPEDDSDPSEDPCSDYVMTLVDCLQSEGMNEDEIKACVECLRKTFMDLEEGTMCLDLEEVGFCDDVVSCEVTATACNNKCTDEITTATACIICSSGCGYAFKSECLSGI